MQSSALQIKVGGVWLSTIATWANPVVTFRRRGGCWALSWEMDVTPGWSHPAVEQGATVEAWLGASRIWLGYLPEFDPAEQTFIANGLCRRLETLASRNTEGPSNNIDTSLFWAAARGSGIGSLSTFGEVASASGLATNIAQLLDMWMEENPTEYWWVDRGGAIWHNADNERNRWYAQPGVASLGVTEDDYATYWMARYVNSATSAWDTVAAANGTVPAVERIISLIDRGPMSTATAQGVVNGLLAKSEQVHGWNRPITLTARDLSNGGGGSVGLGMVQAGDTIRLHGFRDNRRSTSYADAVIGESIWDVDAGTITLRPVDTGARDLRSIVEAVGGEVLL